MIPLTWKQVDTQADPDFVVAPDERLDWARTIGIGSALGGLVAVGVALLVIGLEVHVVGTHWIDVTLPPVSPGRSSR